ncbi:MAG: OmpA family protein [Candidatus Omnitrophica bacterium]|nr:OmpA family protein [Candidatus Omnitrophota bacterium]HOX54256.1 OmpA family protein [Candidatus Omnitrophota bacterium]
MSRPIARIFQLFVIIIISLGLVGCTIIFQKGRRSDVERISDLEDQLSQLRNTKSLLEDKLKQEIADKQVRLELTDKGLVITFVAEVLFDSGKAKIKPEAYSSLDKVAGIIQQEVPNMEIGVEGHTDNQPIKYSGWKSNWELSSARAMSVLHYLVDQKGLAPEKVSAIGCGEFRPVASNDTVEGRKTNRRVEIIILPKFIKSKGAAKASTQSAALEEPEENLK